MAETTAPEAGSKPRTARERVRIELTNEIKDVARQHLAEHGSSGLSLRAVARDVGRVSAAVYRYVPSRDDLLPALIVDSYESVGAEAVAAEAAVPRSDLIGRWMAATRAVRYWAVERPHEYALIFGSPVPGYAAPQDTIDPATIVPRLLLEIVTDAIDNGIVIGDRNRRMPSPLRTDLRQLRESADLRIPDEALVRALMAWTQLIGSISFELFGHLHNVIVDDAAYFGHQMRIIGDELGLRQL